MHSWAAWEHLVLEQILSSQTECLAHAIGNSHLQATAAHSMGCVRKHVAVIAVMFALSLPICQASPCLQSALGLDRAT